MTDNQQLKTMLQTTPECIPVERFEAMSAQDEQHLAGCLRCQAELRMFREFENTQADPQEGAAVAWIAAELRRREQKPERVSVWSRVMSIFVAPRAIVAVATCALALAVYVNIDRGAPELPNQGSSVYRSGEIEVLRPVGELTSAPGDLAWSAIPGSVRYTVRIQEVDNALLWQGTSVEPHVKLPPHVAARAVPGKTLLWKVEAHDATGSVIAASAVQRFRVKTKPIHNGE